MLKSLLPLHAAHPGFASSRIVWGLFVFWAASGWNTALQASCGDWLQHSAADHSVDLQAGRIPSTFPVRPICRGPGCSQSPQREQHSTPTAPFKLVRTDQQFVERLESDLHAAPLVGRTVITDAELASVCQPRLERPPQG